jgi:hypothetical protein
MKRHLFFTALGCAIVVLAVGGWAVDGVRWALRVRGLRPAPATA